MVGTETWRLWVSYLGTHFAGFQHQPGLKTIESALQEAFVNLMGYAPVLTVAGRTDAGVHARGQVVSCTFESRLDAQTLPKALTHFLRPDITVYRADQMPAEFDAKRQSIGKRYVYRLSPSPRELPFDNLFAWHINDKLDLKSMQEAANYLVGDHDFESFRSSQCVAEHARRYIWRIAIEGHHIDIRGNAFCHHMVRIMVGTLVDVGLGKMPPEKVAETLAARDRTRAGRTAPAHGLSLEEVYYPDNLEHAGIPKGAVFPRYPVTHESWPC